MATGSPDPRGRQGRKTVVCPHLYGRFATQFVTLLLLLVLAVPALAVPPESATNIDPSSPFLQARYKSSIAQRRETLMTIADVFNITGNTAQGRLLLNIVERTVLKQLLREPYTPKGDIETAIQDEAAEPELIEALRVRTASAISGEWVKSTGDELGKVDSDYAKTASYTGNSIWLARENKQLRVHLRVAVKNSFALPIDKVEFWLEQKDAAPKYYLALGCRPEDGHPIQSNATKTVMCWGREHVSRAEPAVDWLKGKSVKLSLPASAVRIAGPEILITPYFVRFDDQVSPSVAEAQRQIAAASCEQLRNCEQIERAEHAKRVAKERAERPGRIYVSLLALTVLSLVIILPRVAPRSGSEIRSRLLLLITGATAFSTFTQIVGSLWIFLTPDAGYIGLFVGYVLLQLGLLHVALLIALGGMLAADTKRVTRFRVAVLVLGTGALVAALATLAGES